MVSYGLIICDNRRKFLKQLNDNLEIVDKNFPSFKIYLKGELDKLLLKKPAVDVEEIFASTLKNNREKDFLIGRTNYGANKTDINVVEKKSLKEAKTFSTGQQKTILFLIIFSFIKYLEKVPYKKTIFLLDDIFSYLDNNFIRFGFRKVK